MTDNTSPPGEGVAPLCQGPNPDTKAPRRPTSAGACDTHAHVFGPAAKYPYPPERSYTRPTVRSTITSVCVTCSD